MSSPTEPHAKETAGALDAEAGTTKTESNTTTEQQTSQLTSQQSEKTTTPAPDAIAAPAPLDTTVKPFTETTSSPTATTPTAASPNVAPTATPPTSTNGTNGAAAPAGGLSVKPTNLKDDETIPPDFQGEVQTNNDLPTQATLKKLENHTVLDASRKSHTFKSLYSGPNVARRVLLIFVRHFFCGNCQEYLRMLSAAITPEALLALPVPTFIAVIGCGAPELINSYISETNCPYPVYADPTKLLYNELGMVRTLAMGSRPAYMQNKSVAQTVMSGIVQGLKQVKSGLVLKMGDQRQVGGEFLFEPASLSLDSPIPTPSDEEKTIDLDEKMGPNDNDEKSEEKKVTWCHRMRTTRDHVEIPELMEVLGLDGDGAPKQSAKRRYESALKARKGTGVSMASQMSRASMDAKAASQMSRTSVDARAAGRSSVGSSLGEPAATTAATGAAA
ncbi:hypothetical protein PG999_004849 [Apiospora kogelbergensis]|uniref:Peroxiredoxin n=1 Tax=Apiospora kogelbergensis TaxID=1337665 RepID=A0AAW0R0K2_9PEZI